MNVNLILSKNCTVNNPSEKNNNSYKRYKKAKALISFVSSQTGKGTQRILEYLLTRTYHYGHAKVSQARLAIEANVSIRQVQRVIEALRKMNILHVKGGWDGEKRRSMNTYRVSIIKLISDGLDIQEGIKNHLAFATAKVKRTIGVLPNKIKKIVCFSKWEAPKGTGKIDLGGNKLTKEEQEKGVGKIRRHLEELLQREKRQDDVDISVHCIKQRKTKFKSLSSCIGFT